VTARQVLLASTCLCVAYIGFVTSGLLDAICLALAALFVAGLVHGVKNPPASSDLLSPFRDARLNQWKFGTLPGYVHRAAAQTTNRFPRATPLVLLAYAAALASCFLALAEPMARTAAAILCVTWVGIGLFVLRPLRRHR
jgi:hypothetical protein